MVDCWLLSLDVWLWLERGSTPELQQFWTWLLNASFEELSTISKIKREGAIQDPYPVLYI